MPGKQIKYVAEIPGEDGVLMHNGDNVPLLFNTPEAAFEAGRQMFGVDVWGAAFIVRRVNEGDVESDNHPDILFPNEALREDYPIWIGQNGAKWVRSTYMRILFDILQGANNKTVYRENLAALPDVDPHKTHLTALLNSYLEALDE